MTITSNDSPISASITTGVPVAFKFSDGVLGSIQPTETSKPVSRQPHRPPTAPAQAARTPRRATPARRAAASVRPESALRRAMPTARARALKTSVRFGSLGKGCSIDSGVPIVRRRPSFSRKRPYTFSRRRPRR